MLEVGIVATDSAVVCALTGNLQALTVATFRGAVALCLGEPALIIDLSGVHLIDGAGLNAIVGNIRRAEYYQTRVGLVVPAGNIRKVVDEAGLDLIVNVYETIDLARGEIHDDVVKRDRYWSAPG